MRKFEIYLKNLSVPHTTLSHVNVQAKSMSALLRTINRGKPILGISGNAEVFVSAHNVGVIIEQI